MRSGFRILFLSLFFCINKQGYAYDKLDSLIKSYKDCKVDSTKIRLAIKISKRIKLHENPGDSIDFKYLRESYLNSKLANYPKIKIALCRTLAEAYKRFDMLDPAMRFFKEAVAVGVSINDNEEVALSLLGAAQLLDAYRKHEESRKTMMQGLKYAEKTTNKRLVATLCNGVAAQLHQMGKAEEAIKYFYRSLGINEELKDTSGIVSCLRNVALAYEGMKDFDRTKQLLFRSLNLCLKWRDSSSLSYAYGSIGAMYQNSLKFDSALYYNNKQVQLFPIDIDPDSRGIAYGNLGIIYKAKKDYRKSKECYEKALKLFKSVNSLRLITISNINLGELCVLNKEYSSALSYYDSALQQSEGTNELDVLTAIHSGKYEAYLAIKDYKSALKEFSVARQLEDSLKSAQNLTHILRMESEYEVGKKQKENELLKAQNQIKETQITAAKENQKKTKMFLYSALAVLVVIMVLAVLLYKGLKENKKKNKIISEQKHLVEEKNKDITDSINYAKKIQEAILPPRELKYALFPSAFVFFKPRDIVSGDFYWFTEKNGKRLIAAVDCTGHGVPGAFMSMIGNTFLTEIIEGKGITQPSEILSELRHLVIKALKQSDDVTENKDGMDMAILCFDDENKTVEYAGANNPMWMIRDGELTEYKADKRPIGYYRGEGLPFTNHKIDCKKGDSFYIFTDGYADQFGGPKGKKFKYKQLQDILVSVQKEEMLKQEEVLDRKFEDWKGQLDQIDDVLIIGVRV